MTQQTRTVSRNFRFDAQSAQVLEFESQRRGMSLNSLVNHVFRKYADFDRLAEKTDMVTINRSLLGILLDLTSGKDLYDAVFEYGKRSGHDNLLFWKKENSAVALKEYLTTVLCDFCNLGEYDLSLKDDTFVITHDLGPKGSIFLKAYIAGIIEGCTERPASVEATGSTLRFNPIQHTTGKL